MSQAVVEAKDLSGTKAVSDRSQYKQGEQKTLHHFKTKATTSPLVKFLVESTDELCWGGFVSLLSFQYPTNW